MANTRNTAPADAKPELDKEKIKEGRTLVTSVKFQHLKEPKGNTLAFATVELVETVLVRDVRVVKGSKGNFISWPSKKIPAKGDKPEDYIDLVYFRTAEDRLGVSDEILDRFSKDVPASTDGQDDPPPPSRRRGR